jgi:predicted transposase YdaD
LIFRYQVVRVWQLPVETFLNGGLGILPLAPLSTVTENELPAVIAQMEQRIRAEATPEEAGTLWTAADVLMGLRYPRDLVAQLLQGVHGMKESVTYQAIVEEGKIEGKMEGKMEGKIEARQEVLLELGQKRFGTPDASTETAVRAIADLERLKQLSERLLDASSWEELLGAP